MRPIAPEEGLQMLEAIADRNVPHAAAFHVDWPRFLEARPALAQWTVLEGVRSAPVQAPAKPQRRRSTVATVTRPAFADELRQLSPARRADTLLRFIADHVARVVGAPDGESIDPTQPLNEIGLDSLMAVDLRNRLGAGLGLTRNLPATLVFDHPTLNALARYLDAEIVPAAAAAPLPMTEAKTAASISALSDTQIDELFANKTKKR
jgi:hypothetical protein